MPIIIIHNYKNHVLHIDTNMWHAYETRRMFRVHVCVWAELYIAAVTNWSGSTGWHG